MQHANTTLNKDNEVWSHIHNKA